MPPGPGRFPTTRWSVVLATRQHETPGALEALETLCRIYWRPLHTYVLRHGYSTEEAEDLTQGFFARLLEKRYRCFRPDARSVACVSDESSRDEVGVTVGSCSTSPRTRRLMTLGGKAGVPRELFQKPDGQLFLLLAPVEEALRAPINVLVQTKSPARAAGPP